MEDRQGVTTNRLPAGGSLMTVYLSGCFVDKGAARISPDDRGFLFADGVYEVIRWYDGRLFEAEAHLDRLRDGLSKMRIACDAAGELPRIGEELLRRNGAPPDRMKLYVQITRGAARRTHAFPAPGTPPTVYAEVAPIDTSPEELEHGVDAITTADQRWARCDIKSTSLLANVLANQAALEAGACEAIMLKEGVVTEASHSSVFAVTDGEVRTAPLSNLILAGITRKVVLELCDELRLAVREFPLTESELRSADEVFLAGTSCEVMPVVRLDGRPIADGRPGAVTRRLGQAFTKRIGTG